MNGFGDPLFWGQYLIGLLATLWWVITAEKGTGNPVSAGSLWGALVMHQKTLFSAALAHLLVCVILWEGKPLVHYLPSWWPVSDRAGLLNPITSIASGYGAQSQLANWLGAFLRPPGFPPAPPKE